VKDASGNVVFQRRNIFDSEGNLLRVIEKDLETGEVKTRLRAKATADEVREAITTTGSLEKIFAK